MIDIIILQALFGMAIPVSKSLLVYSSPFFLAGFRLFGGGVLLFAYHNWYKKKPITLNWQHILAYGQIIFFGVYARSMLRYWSFQYLSAIKIACLLNVTPFIAATLSYLILGERCSIKQLIGMTIGFLGIVPLLLSASSSGLCLEGMCISIPECVLLLAIVSHCYGMIVSCKLLRNHNNISVSMTHGIRMLGGGTLCLISAYFIEGSFSVAYDAEYIVKLGMLILLSNVIGNSWHLYLLKKYSVTFLSLSDFLGSLFTTLYGVLFLHEAILWHHIISAGCAGIGLYIFYQDEGIAPYPSRVVAEK